MACAVRATTGVRLDPGPARSRSRIAARAWKPSMTGICRSIRTRSNGPDSISARAWRPSGGDDSAVAELLEHVGGDDLVNRVVLGQQDAEWPGRGPRVGRGVGVGRRRPAVAEERREDVEQLGLPDRLGQPGRDGASEPAVLVDSGGEQDDWRPGVGQRPRGGLAVDHGHGERPAGIPGSAAGVGGRPRRRRRPSAPSASRRASRRRWPGPSRCRERPAPAGRRATLARWACPRPPRRGRIAPVKRKRLPPPGASSTQIRPPISATSRAEIVRPRPVPP